jgi:hypothetical protein
MVYFIQLDEYPFSLIRRGWLHIIYTQGCKLLSDIGQCPTKFGKCPSKSNFDRTLVRSQKKIVTLYIFLLWQNPIANSLNLHFAIKFTRHSSILLNVAPEWLYILVSWLIYILWRIYVRPNLVVLVFVRPNSSYVRPKLKVIGQMPCQVKYLFAALVYKSQLKFTNRAFWI